MNKKTSIILTIILSIFMVRAILTTKTINNTVQESDILNKYNVIFNVIGEIEHAENSEHYTAIGEAILNGQLSINEFSSLIAENEFTQKEKMITQLEQWNAVLDEKKTELYNNSVSLLGELQQGNIDNINDKQDKINQGKKYAENLKLLLDNDISIVDKTAVDDLLAGYLEEQNKIEQNIGDLLKIAEADLTQKNMDAIYLAVPPSLPANIKNVYAGPIEQLQQNLTNDLTNKIAELDILVQQGITQEEVEQRKAIILEQIQQFKESVNPKVVQWVAGIEGLIED